MTLVRPLLAAAICLCISLFAFPAARAQAPSAQRSGSLPGGGSYIVLSNPAAHLAAIELWFRAPGAGYNSSYPGISRLAVTALAASKPAHGTPLTEAVSRAGGSLTIATYPDIVMVGAIVPAASAPAMVRALTGVYFTPSITDDGIKAALRDSAAASAESKFDPERTLQDELFARLFSSGPAHYPPIPSSAAAFSKISPDDLKAFAQRAFRAPNAVLTLAGAVQDGLVSNAAAGSGGAPMDPPYDSTVATQPPDASMPADVSGIGFAWAGAPIADERAATALDFVADYLFDPDTGVVAAAARKKSANLFVNGQFITLHAPGVLLATISGTGSDALRQQVLDAVTSMQTPLDGKTFDAARNAFEYHLLHQTQTPRQRADNFGWYAAEGNAAYAPGDPSGAYMKAASSLDPAFVADTVRKYLTHPVVVQLHEQQHQQQQGTAI